MKKRILFGILVVILAVAIIFGWLFFGPTVNSPKDKYAYIATGSDYNKVVEQLQQQDVIGSATWFNMASRIIGYKSIRPGRYPVKNGMSIVGLVRMLRNGQQDPVDFVVTKIRTKEILAGRLGKAFEFDSAAMLLYMNSTDSLREYGLDSNTVMAAVLPYTYTSKWNTTPGKIFGQFFNSYKSFWTEERRQKAASLGYTPLQITTIASIIEEETNAATDKPNVASVYMNRIAKGMPLQADPTVKFALKDFSLKRIYEKHTRVESPWNTYVNRGLPPGPICTPSLATINAVLDAPKTDYIYFVASSAFDGTHVFTTNYNDHLKYARIYQQELNKRNIR